MAKRLTIAVTATLKAAQLDVGYCFAERLTSLPRGPETPPAGDGCGVERTGSFDRGLAINVLDPAVVKRVFAKMAQATESLSGKGPTAAVLMLLSLGQPDS